MSGWAGTTPSGGCVACVPAGHVWCLSGNLMLWSMPVRGEVITSSQNLVGKGMRVWPLSSEILHPRTQSGVLRNVISPSYQAI